MACLAGSSSGSCARRRSLPARLRIGAGDAGGDDRALVDVLGQFRLGGEGPLVEHAGAGRGGASAQPTAISAPVIGPAMYTQ